MCKQLITSFLIFTVLGFTVVAPAIGQIAQSKQEKKTAKVKEKIKKLGLGERVKIKAKLYSGTTYQGYVSQVNEDDFVVVDKNGNSNTVKYSDVDSVGGRNLSTGAKIAIGVGIGVGATILTILAIIASLDD